MILNKLQLCV